MGTHPPTHPDPYAPPYWKIRAVNLSTLVRDTLGQIFHVVFFGSVALPPSGEKDDDPRLARFHHMLKETLDLFHHAQEHFVAKYSEEIDAEKLFEMHGVTHMDDILVTQVGEAFYDLVREYRNVYFQNNYQDGTDCALVPVLWASGGIDDREVSATLVNALIAAAEAIGSVALNLFKQLVKTKSSFEDAYAGKVDSGLEDGGHPNPRCNSANSAFRTALLAELQQYNASRSAAADANNMVNNGQVNNGRAAGDLSSLDKLPRLDAFLCCNKVNLCPWKEFHNSCESSMIHANPP